MKLEKWQRVNAGPSVGLRPSYVPALTYSATLSKNKPVQTNKSSGPVWVTRSKGVDANAIFTKENKKLRYL